MDRLGGTIFKVFDPYKKNGQIPEYRDSLTAGIFPVNGCVIAALPGNLLGIIRNNREFTCPSKLGITGILQ